MYSGNPPYQSKASHQYRGNEERTPGWSRRTTGAENEPLNQLRRTRAAHEYPAPAARTIRRKDESMAKKKRQTFWTKEKLRTLRKLFPHISTFNVACILGAGFEATKKKASRLGLRKSHKRTKALGHP